MKIVAKTGATVVMVTHDVDEAVLLSDRIVMMTNGPAATIGEMLRVDLPRPRDRVETGRGPRATSHCRKQVLDFLYTRHSHVEQSGLIRSARTGPRMKKIETGRGRQRHGRRAHARRAAEARARPLRHHGVRRRAAPQLQPHPAVAGAGRRADARRDRAQPARLVSPRTASRCTSARRWSQIDRARARRARRRRHRGSRTTGCCWPPAPTPSSCRCRARTCEGVIAYRDIADTEAMIDAAAQVQARGGHRRRPARAWKRPTA